MEQEIQNLDSIAAAEAAVEAQKNSWTTWLLSPMTKKAEDTEETARKDRRRQERRIEKDMKERRLVLKEADLQREENRSRKAKEEVDAADLDDDGKIRVIEARISTRETRERLEREKAERERMTKLWKQEREQREAAEALRKQQAEERAAEQKRQEETRKWHKIINDRTRTYREQYAHLNRPEGGTRQAYTSTCRHDGWWPKVQGRTACPECHDVWTYLLQCPYCQMKACSRCQSAIRRRMPRNAARTNRPNPFPGEDSESGF